MLKVIREYGFSAEEVYKAILTLPKIPFTDEDILLIRNNPNLNWYQRKRLIKYIEKNMSIK